MFNINLEPLIKIYKYSKASLHYDKPYQFFFVNRSASPWILEELIAIN